MTMMRNTLVGRSFVVAVVTTTLWGSSRAAEQHSALRSGNHAVVVNDPPVVDPVDVVVLTEAMW